MASRATDEDGVARFSEIPPGRYIAHVNQGLLGPTLPTFWAYNPAYAQVQNEHSWSAGWMDIIQSGMAPQAAAEKAMKRVEEIFAKYPIT